MDETRIERALRQGPPFRTAYAHRPLPLASETGQHASGLLLLVAVAVLLVVAVGGAALVGSACVPLPVPTAPPVRPDMSAAPAPRAESTWTATGSMITPLNGPTVLLADGRVLVAGGSDEIGIGQVASELYDPRTGSWPPPASCSKLAREPLPLSCPMAESCCPAGPAAEATWRLPSCTTPAPGHGPPPDPSSKPAPATPPHSCQMAGCSWQAAQFRTATCGGPWPPPSCTTRAPGPGPPLSP